MKKTITISFLVLCGFACTAQAPDGSQPGAWYMYFFTKRFGESRFGIQGDYQYRSWNHGSDLEQLLLRTGATYRPRNADITFTLGYAYVTTGAFGDSDVRVMENRVYQEATLHQKIGTHFLVTHRFRYEQRWMENLDFRTRYRYWFFFNVPLTNEELVPKTVYLAFYNEIFINGQRNVGSGLQVDYFDRNRTYLAAGYVIANGLRIQLGWMQQTTSTYSKGQVQVSAHHNF